MRGLWTVSRHTFAQALRMKVAGVFILLLIVALVALPFMMKGDGTLAGKTRTFLNYSTAATSALLSLITIFVSTAVITSDVRGKQVFTVVSKPLPRWQYVLGRWLGVMLLVVILLVVAGVVIYALAQHLRQGEAINPTDRRTVETEVFTARVRVPPDWDRERIGREIGARVKKLRDAGEYEGVLDSYKAKHADEKRAVEELIRELEKQVTQSMQSVRPGGNLLWEFSGIQVAGQTITGKAQVAIVRKDLRQVMFKADRALVARLIFRGPVRVGGVDAGVIHLSHDAFVAMFSIEGMKRGGISRLKPGQEVEFEIDPTIQISYKAKPSGKVPDRKLKSVWYVENPETGYPHFEPPRSDPEDRPTTLTVSSRVVSGEGKTRARYVNLVSTSVTILRDDISVLYRVGAFGPNFVRAFLLILCQLAFLAGLGVLAGTFLSFPVACLLCFGTLPFSLAREFLIDAVKLPKGGIVASDVFTAIGHYILEVMRVIMPDFARTSAGDHLVEGMYISWSSLAGTLIVVLGVQTVVLLVLACVIFHKRELARVQV